MGRIRGGAGGDIWTAMVVLSARRSFRMHTNDKTTKQQTLISQIHFSFLISCSISLVLTSLILELIDRPLVLFCYKAATYRYRTVDVDIYV